MPHEHPHLNAYHLKESLLYQFILAELIRAFEQLEIVNDLRFNLEKKRTRSVYQHLLNELAAKIKEFAGMTPDYTRLYSWNVEYGTLTKLKHYWTYFCILVEPEEVEAVELERQGSHAWFLCMECLDLIRRIQISSANQKVLREELIQKLKRVDQTMQRFSKQIALWMQTFSRDEYVLFYLLRNQKALERIYGTEFFPESVAKMHPQGIRGISRFVANRYKKKGFHDLIRGIEQELTGLKSI